MMAAQPYKEVPGDALSSQAAFERYVMKLGRMVLDLERDVGNLYTEQVFVKGIRLRAPRHRSGEWLAVMTIDTSDGGKVAFVGGDDLTACVRSLSAKLRNGTMQWKDDEYAGS